MEKTFSQKTARFFEIADYFLLIPATFGLILSLFTLDFAVWLFLIVSLIYAAGCSLFYGFIKHSRQQLPRRAAVWLWSGTMVYNLLHSLFWVALSANARQAEDAFWFGLCSIWGLLVFVLASLSLKHDLMRLE